VNSERREEKRGLKCVVRGVESDEEIGYGIKVMGEL
jgi:hypothetical protein